MGTLLKDCDRKTYLYFSEMIRESKLWSEARKKKSFFPPDKDKHALRAKTWLSPEDTSYNHKNIFFIRCFLHSSFFPLAYGEMYFWSIPQSTTHTHKWNGTQLPLLTSTKIYTNTTKQSPSCIRRQLRSYSGLGHKDCCLITCPGHQPDNT